MQIALLQTIFSTLYNLGFAWLAGLLFARICLRGDESDWSDRVQFRMRASMLPASLVCIVCGFGLQWCEAAALGETTLQDAGPALALLLRSTHYGHAGIVGLTALMVLAGVSLIGKVRPGGVVISSLLFVVVALSKVAVSHAAEVGIFSLAVVMELLHLLTISLWVGAVCVSAWQVLLRSDESQPAVNNYLQSLSRCATIALAGIVASGLFNAARMLWHADNVIGHPYTNTLLTKICLVLFAAALGGFNRYAGLPTLFNLTTPKARRDVLLSRIILVLRLESLVLVAVLYVAAVLAATAAP